MLFKSLDHELRSNEDYVRSSSSHNVWNPTLNEAGSNSCAKICPSHFISSQYFLQFSSTHRKGSPSIDLDYQEREYASRTKLPSWIQGSARPLFPPFTILVQGELRPRTISLLPHLTSFSFNLAGVCSCLILRLPHVFISHALIVLLVFHLSSLQSSYFAATFHTRS